MIVSTFGSPGAGTVKRSARFSYSFQSWAIIGRARSSTHSAAIRDRPSDSSDAKSAMKRAPLGYREEEPPAFSPRIHAAMVFQSGSS